MGIYWVSESMVVSHSGNIMTALETVHILACRKCDNWPSGVGTHLIRSFLLDFYYRTTLAIPVIDGIDWNNFRYNPVYQGKELFRGIFEWGFLYKESKVPDRELVLREHNSEPYK